MGLILGAGEVEVRSGVGADELPTAAPVLDDPQGADWVRSARLAYGCTFNTAVY